MSSEKPARDRLNNQRFKDIYVHASQEPWIPFFPGIDFKVLRASQETGHWTVLLKCAKGSGIPRHEHLGAGEYYVVAGKMEVRGGAENGGRSEGVYAATNLLRKAYKFARPISTITWAVFFASPR